MFSWLRALVLLAPAGVLAGIYWLGDHARQFDYRSDDDLIVAVRTLPSQLDPRFPRDEIEREISDLVFDRWLRLDDELRLRPHLVKDWRYEHWVRWHFRTEAAAREGAKAIEDLRDRWSDWSIEECVADGDEVHVHSSDPGERWVKEVAEVIDRESLSPLLEVKLVTREAVRPSFEAFLAGSVEKEKLHHVDFEGTTRARLFLQGETDLFLKELRLFYESNRDLEPEIEVKGMETRIDRLNFEMTLSDRFRWHDGRPVTAKDFRFSFAELTRSRSSWPWRGAFEFVDRLEVVDDYRIRVHCREFYAPALERWGKLLLLPAHRLEGAITVEDWQTFFREPIGTGPYRVLPVVGDDEIVLEAFSGYPRGTPRQTTVRYRRATPGPDRRLMVRRDLVDIFEPDGWELARIRSGDWKVGTAEDLGRFRHAVAWNLDRDLFRDPKVRQALAHGIDLEALRESVSGERLREWTGLFFPGAWFCPETVSALPVDPERAAKLLEEAGWRFEAGQWQRKRKEGEDQPLEFRLGFDRDNDLQRVIAEFLAMTWKTQGVRVVLEPLTWSELIDEHLVKRQFDALLLDWEMDFSRDLYAAWHSSQAGVGGSNFSGLRNQEIDGLLEQLRRESDPEAITKLTRALQTEIRNLQPCLFVGSTGRRITFREGAVLQSPPSGSDDAIHQPARPISVGPAGVYASRPWWVRSEREEGPLGEKGGAL